MPRSRPLPQGWEALREACLRRDRRCCVKCGKPGNEADHVVPAWRGGADHLDNLQTLCRTHHARKTAKDTAEFRSWQRKMNSRGDLPPGMARQG